MLAWLARNIRMEGTLTVRLLAAVIHAFRGAT